MEVFLAETETMLTKEAAANSRTIRSGTLVLTASGATLGVRKILAVTGCANDGVVAFEGLSNATNKFFLYYYPRSLTENLRYRIKLRQAIEEGFILDVVKNHTTYATYYRLVKAIEDDPNLPKKFLPRVRSMGLAASALPPRR